MLNPNTQTAAYKYFLELGKDSHDWDGVPLFEGGQVEKGYLTALKKEGLISTIVEHENNATQVWIVLTEQGKEYVEHNAIDWVI